MSEYRTTRTSFVVPRGGKRHRAILKYVLISIIILGAAAAISREWISFQARVLFMKLGSTGTRQQSLQWFVENDAQRAASVFFDTFLEHPELRDLATEGLLKQDQQKLVPVYMSLWREQTGDQDLRNRVLELIADHAGERCFFLFTDPSMVLSPDSNCWALAYDYLNANASKEMLGFLISRYYVGDARSRRASVTALSYLKENAVLAGSPALRRMLFEAIRSEDDEVRFRAIQALGPVASTRDIPDLLFHLQESDEGILSALGSLLRYLARPPASKESEDLKGLRDLALAVAKVQEKRYPQEVVRQLGLGALVRLRGMVQCGDGVQADSFAAELALRTQAILTDIPTSRFVSYWNHFERSLLPKRDYSKALRSKEFGVALNRDCGKVNYGQILALGAGRVIYCADVDAWEQNYERERKRLLLHRALAEKAGLEQAIRVIVSEDVLGEVGMFSSTFSRILGTSRYGEGVATKFFEISLKPGVDPVTGFNKFAELFKEASTIAKRLDESITLFLGTVDLGNRRWYGPGGAIEKILLHAFAEDQRSGRHIDGISVSSSLPPGKLAVELAELGKSLRLSTSKITLWCTSLSRPSQELRTTTAHLERDFVQSMQAASELPACVALLAASGVKVFFFDPFKDSVLCEQPHEVRLDGMLYTDCMPRPLYHAAGFVVHVFGGRDIYGAEHVSSAPDSFAIVFAMSSNPVAVAWSNASGASVDLEVDWPAARVTYTSADAVGNFSSAIVQGKDNKISVPLAGGSAVITPLAQRPSVPHAAAGSELEAELALKRLPFAGATHRASYGTHDRSGSNDDGFSGTSSYLYRKAPGEYVVFDARGPGVIHRVWMGRTEKISRVRFYFDGAGKPAIDVTPQQLFGDGGLLGHPVAASGSSAGGGSLLTIPIRFSRRVVIATVGPPKFVQVDYSLLDSGTKAESASLTALKQQSKKLAAQYERLSGDSLHKGCQPHSVEKNIHLLPGENATIARLVGPGVIRCLRVSCANVANMKNVLLQIYWDNKTTVGFGSYLADIFGQKFGASDWRGSAMGFSGGEGYIHYPMPFKRSATVCLSNRGSSAASVHISASSAPLGPQETTDRYFCCHWKTAIGTRDKDLRLLSIKGAGHFVGCILSLFAPNTFSYLDSDILIFADDAEKPVLHSTGIDDYFGGSNFYEGGTFHLPYCGLMFKKDGATLQYRLNIADAMYFSKSFDFQIEAIPAEIKGAVFSGSFFWYSESPTGGD